MWRTSCGIVLRTYQAHTGGIAAFDLVLQAGPAAIAEETVLALPDAEHSLQQVQTFPDRAGIGIGAEIASLARAAPRGAAPGADRHVRC